MRARTFFWLPTLAIIAASACTADVESEGELPNVEVDGGALPEVDVNAADVNITSDTQRVVTPDIDVNPPAANP